MNKGKEFFNNSNPIEAFQAVAARRWRQRNESAIKAEVQHPGSKRILTSYTPQANSGLDAYDSYDPKILRK